MTCEGEWPTKGSFLPVEYRGFWQKHIKSLAAQGFSVLVWVKVKHGQCEQIFALLGPKL